MLLFFLQNFYTFYSICTILQLYFSVNNTLGMSFHLSPYRYAIYLNLSNFLLFYSEVGNIYMIQIKAIGIYFLIPIPVLLLFHSFSPAPRGKHLINFLNILSAFLYTDMGIYGHIFFSPIFFLQKKITY